MGPSEAMRVLTRRRDWLQSQVDANAYSEAAAGRACSEIAALNVAIPLVQIAVDHAQDDRRLRDEIAARRRIARRYGVDELPQAAP